MKFNLIAGAALAALVGLAMFIGLNASSAGNGPEEKPEDQSVGGCLDPAASDQAVDAILGSTDELSTSADTAQTLEATASKEEAQEILAFDARVPQAPAGWTGTTTIVNRSGDEVFAQCHLRTVLTDPSVSETITVPAEEIITETGETAVREAFDWTVNKSAEVLVRFAYPSEPVGLEIEPAEGLSVAKGDVNGAEAQIVTRDYDEPSIVISWHDDGLSLSATCSLMTVEECIAIAASTG